MKDFKTPTHCYIGRLPCGCILASVYDMPGMARYIAEMVRDGLVVERVPRSEARPIWECVHQPQQLLMEVNK